MGVETLDAVADRGYYAGEEICACEEAGITVTLPKPMTSNAKAAGRFGKQDFRYVAAEDAYVCPAGQSLAYSFTTEDKGLLPSRRVQRLATSVVIVESGHSLAHIRDTALNEKPRSMPGLSRFRFDV